MKKFYCCIVIICCFLTGTHCQLVQTAEYFFDTDPGQGHAVAIHFPAADPVSLQNVSVNAAGLNNGYHFFYVRVKDSYGKWGHYRRQRFYVFDNNIVTVVPTTGLLTQAEYFFDKDPGPGHAVPISIPTADTVSIPNAALNAAGLSNGYHMLYVRVKANNGRWGHYRRRRFYVFDNSPLATGPPLLTKAEYWVDSLPVPGTGKLISLPAKDTVFYNDSIPGLHLDSGWHVLSLRVQNNKGNWSAVKQDSIRIEYKTPDSLQISFTATRTGATNFLFWITSHEIYTDHFDVEKSIDAQDFSYIGSVKAGLHAYNFIDNKPYNGINYYRLKIINTDGNFTYSEIRSVDNSNKTLLVYPNPVVDKTIYLYAPASFAGKYTIVLYSIDGKLVFIKELTLTTGSSVQTIGLPLNLAKGVYVIRISSGTDVNVFHKKLIVE